MRIGDYEVVETGENDVFPGRPGDDGYVYFQVPEEQEAEIMNGEDVYELWSRTVMDS